LAIPIKFNHGSRRLQKDQLFEQSRHLTIGWSLKPDSAIPASHALAE